MADKLIIFDTTLRDGEQSPGASMTKDEKLRIARQLERLRVDVIEAGFAASSNGDFEAVRAIAGAALGAAAGHHGSPSPARCLASHEVAATLVLSSFVPQVAHSTVTDTVQIRLTTRPR